MRKSGVNGFSTETIYGQSFYSRAAPTTKSHICTSFSSSASYSDDMFSPSCISKMFPNSTSAPSEISKAIKFTKPFNVHPFEPNLRTTGMEMHKFSKPQIRHHPLANSDPPCKLMPGVLSIHN